MSVPRLAQSSQSSGFSCRSPFVAELQWETACVAAALSDVCASLNDKKLSNDIVKLHESDIPFTFYHLYITDTGKNNNNIHFLKRFSYKTRRHQTTCSHRKLNQGIICLTGRAGKAFKLRKQKVGKKQNNRSPVTLPVTWVLTRFKCTLGTLPTCKSPQEVHWMSSNCSQLCIHPNHHFK